MMKMNKWTLGLAAVGLVTIPVTMQAEEKMSQLNTALSNTSISGYVDTSMQWQIGDARGNVRPPAYAFNHPSKQDGFNLNAVNLVIEKPLDATDSWAAGYKLDMVYGPNAVGWNPSVNTQTPDAWHSGDLSLKQAYVALRAPVGNGLDFKVGVFDTIIGYESFNAGSNPNYTRSYGYTMEPTQHTGVLASYQFSKEFGIAAGIANTYNSIINNRAFGGVYGVGRPEYYKTYMGAITLSAPDSWGALAGSTLYVGVVNGFDTGLTTDNNCSFYAGATVNTGIKGLKAGVAYDYRDSEGVSGSSVGGGMWANAVALYLSYQATEKLSFHGRAEYAWMDHQLASSGMPYKVLAITGTIQYDLWANVLSRLEFRWDHDAANHGYTENYNDNDRNVFMVADRKSVV